MQQCASPEYFRGVSPYVNSPELVSYLRTPDPSGGYVGVPLEPPGTPMLYRCEPEEHDGPSTADIIANQSQDYVDEKLAEYQATIQQLQGRIALHLTLSIYTMLTVTGSYKLSRNTFFYKE